MADFDATQAIDLSDCDDETDDEVADEDKKPIAHLKVLSNKGFPETLFPIYDGNNVVGRQEGTCNVFIPLKALSKQHACIEVRGEQHFLVDKRSRNKTRRGKMFLLPEAKYELQSGDQLMFADVSCVYLREGADNVPKASDGIVDKDDSGSETGSESVLLPEEEEEEGRGGEKALIEETIYEEASDPSSDLLQPTQVFPADGIGLHQPPTSTSVPDSDPETDPAERTQEDCEPVTVAETPATQRSKGVDGDRETKGEKHVTMALTETVTYYEEEEEDEDERARMACEPTQAYDSGGETDEGDGLDENRSSAIFEAATQVCVDFEAETQVCVDFEAETQVCVDFEAETQVVADPEATGDNVRSMVKNYATPKKMPENEKKMSKLVSAAGDADKTDGKSTYSDSDSSCGSPVFPSSLGREEEGTDGGDAVPSVTPSLYALETPTLRRKREIGDAEFARPFPVANRTPRGFVVKPRINDHDRQQGDSPVQLPATVTSDATSDVTSDATLCSARVGVTDTDSVVESPEGSTGFEPKMHSTQISGKSCHDDSFPSLRLDMSQQDACLPCSEGSRHVSTDDTCTQANDEDDVSKQREGHGVITDDITAGGCDRGGTEGTDTTTGVAAKEKNVALNSDDVCTQAYGHAEGFRGNPTEGSSVTNSDDVSTQAYGEDRVTDYPNRRGRITTNSDDVSTQAYDEEGVTDYPNKRKGIAANSDDISTQAYGEEGVTDYPNKGGHSDVNSDDVCTQAYTWEETAPLRSSPRKRQGRKRTVPILEDPPANSGSGTSEVVESSQPGEDEEEEEGDILMPLCVGRQFRRSAVRRADALSEIHSLGGSIQQPKDPAIAPGQRKRVSRRTQSQGPSEITPVATTRRHSLGTEGVGSTRRQGNGTGEPKPRTARGSRKTVGNVGGAATIVKKANEVTVATARRTRRAAEPDVEPLAEPVKKAKLSVKEQKETKTRSVRSVNTKKPLMSAGQKGNEMTDEEGTVEKVIEQNESETRSKRSRSVAKPSMAAAQEESENVNGVHVNKNLLKVGKQGETNPRSTRNRKTIVNDSPVKEENETNSGEHIENKPLVIREQSESKPRSMRDRKSVNEKRLPTEENETNDGEQKAKPSEVSKPVSRTSKGTTEKPTMTVRGRKSEKSTMCVIAEQEVTKTRSNKTNADNELRGAEERVKGGRQSARRRTSLVPEATQPKTRRTVPERESLTSTETGSKTRSAKEMGNPPEAEQRESEPRSTRNRKQIEEKPAIASKQKESKNNVGELSSLAMEQTESKTVSKRSRESIVGNPQDSSMPQGRKSARRSSVNVANKNKLSQVKVKATLNSPESPKQKENVPFGKSPKRRQTSLAPASDVDSSQPCKRSRGRQLPVVPPSSLSTSLRERHPSSRPQVMFTGMFDSHGEQILKNLGGQIVDSVYECTHLVTDRVRRTVKFLCGLGRGIPIVGPGWLLSCREANTFTDFDRFLVLDEESERKFHFSLATSLRKAASGGLLVGYRIHVTTNVKPEPKQMKDIIQCAGGEYLASVPRTYQEKTVVISCDADRACCLRTLHGDIPVVSPEFLLTGILRQEVDIDQYQLAATATTAKAGRSSRKKR